MRMFIVLVAAGVGAAAWASAGAQVLQPRANQGTGVVTVGGTVDIGNTPSVKAGQLGDWRVTLANAPDVNVANTASVSVVSPEFLKMKRTYEVTWTDGTRESIVVEQVERGGWLRVGEERWVNLGLARSVQARQ